CRGHRHAHPDWRQPSRQHVLANHLGHEVLQQEHACGHPRTCLRRGGARRDRAQRARSACVGADVRPYGYCLDGLSGYQHLGGHLCHLQNLRPANRLDFQTLQLRVCCDPDNRHRSLRWEMLLESEGCCLCLSGLPLLLGRHLLYGLHGASERTVRCGYFHSCAALFSTCAEHADRLPRLGGWRVCGAHHIIPSRLCSVHLRCLPQQRHGHHWRLDQILQHPELHV
ncbi:unnamed protein product, partial [Symbiodinium necroappetens]